MIVCLRAMRDENRVNIAAYTPRFIITSPTTHTHTQKGVTVVWCVRVCFFAQQPRIDDTNASARIRCALLCVGRNNRNTQIHMPDLCVSLCCVLAEPFGINLSSFSFLASARLVIAQ